MRDFGPTTVLKLAFSGDKERSPVRYRMVLRPAGDADAFFMADVFAEVLAMDALDQPSWRPVGKHDPLDLEQLLRCAVGRLPELLVAGRRPSHVVNDVVEIDLGTFEAAP